MEAKCDPNRCVSGWLPDPDSLPSQAQLQSTLMKLKELALRLGAELREAPGSASPAGEREIIGVAGLEVAGPDEVSFVSNPRYAALAQHTRAGAVLVEPDAGELPIPTLRVANPYLAFAKAVDLFYRPPVYPAGVHPTAVIDAEVVLPSDIHIGPYVVVGATVHLREGTVLLAHTVLYPGVEAGPHLFCHAHVVVRENSRLGSHVTLGNGVVVGGDGFGFAKDDTGTWHKIPQSGRAVLGDHVEVQANSCVDRASIGETRIEAGAKVDNLVQVGHGSTVGEHTLLCAQVGLAGSSHIGNRVILAGQVGVAGHLSIGDGAIATAQTGIPHDVPAKETVSGSPAIPNRQWLRASAAFARLPEILRRIGRLERLVANREDSMQ